MSMYNLLAITNRHLCNGNILDQIKKIISLNIDRNKNDRSLLSKSNIKIVLREKDLSEKDYESLAKKVLSICDSSNIECILHTYYNSAKRLNCRSIHVPLHILRENPHLYKEFQTVGVSIHSVKEAVEAQNLHAAYITAGHIFETSCKKGLPGRGLDFLHEVTDSVNIPVYAIGGISENNIDSVIENGAYGACIMSGAMKV